MAVEARRPVSRPVPGLLAVLVASTLLSVGSGPFDAGSGLSRALSVVLPPACLGLAALVLCQPSRAAVTAALLGGVLAGPVRGLFYDPIRDLACTRCLPSPYALFPNATRADAVAVVGGALVTAGLVAATVRRRSVWAALAAAVAGLSAAAYDSPHGVRVGAVWAVAALAGLDATVAVVRLALARNAMTKLAQAMRSGRSPEEALRANLRDPAAWVEFAAAGSGEQAHWVTADGTPVPEQQDAAGTALPRHTTLVRARGIPVARLRHTRPLVTVTPELALSLEQAGLEAGLAHQVAELVASRTRIVARADAERRQLERDLHDGAQQYLLALALELSLADPDAGGAAAAQTRAAVRDSRADAEAALAELRTIARGVYPVLLTSGGFPAALQAMGRRVGTTVTVHGLDLAGLPLSAAAAVYGLVEELATSATGPLVVTVSGGDARNVEVTGATVAVDSINLERVMASGGTVEVVPGRTVVSFP